MSGSERPMFSRWLVLAAQAVAVVLAVLVLTLVSFALLPVSTAGLGSHPAPLRTYAQARVALAETDRAEVTARVKPVCRTRLLGPGRRTAQVMVLYHGLTNCPRQMLDLGRALAGTGANVLVVRIPGHGISGGTVAGLSDLDAQAMREATDASLDIAAGLGEKTTVVGLSLGGNMAAWAAQERPDVDRALLIAPALMLGNASPLAARAFRNAFTRLPAIIIPGTNVQREPHTYPDATPVRPSAEAFRLGTRVMRTAQARPARAPALAVLDNAADRTVSTAAIETLIGSWRGHGQWVRRVTLPASLALPHDLMDHTQRGARPALIDPIAVALATGAPLPRPLPPGTRVSDR